jgi:Peptidase of plants and bacteria
MKNHTSIVSAGIFLLAVLLAHAEVAVTVGHNENDDATAAFKFKNVPSPSAGNAAMRAKFTIVDGDIDPNSGGLSKLNDGKLPDAEDQPDENFFFNAGASGGRLEADLGGVIGIRQINTYSWHPNTRGPQVYKLYASDGASKDFNVAPTNGVNPETCGWKLIATVNTKAKDDGDNGGQYGVSISDTNGVIGKYRYLLFDIASTESDDDSGNTFFSEINVIDANAPAVAENSTAQTASSESFTFKTVDGKCEITVNTAAAPGLKDWAEKKLAPVLAEWYPKIVALLPSEGFTAPTHYSITIKPMDGVAYTSGTRVAVSKKWIEDEMNDEAVGSLVHESVHVVQQFRDYNGQNPGWLVEGSADYVRWFLYDADKHGADIVWMRHLRNFTPRYDASYRVTANFLNWVSEKYDKDIVAQMNAAMRQDKYDDNLWKEYTGKTMQELGAEWKKEVMAQLAAPAESKKEN